VKPHAAIILAAGLSRRIKKFKPLLPVGGKTFIDHLISTFLSNDAEVYVVVGYHGEELREATKNRDVVIVDNPDYKLGMFTSVQAGVNALSSACEAFFIMPVDIPLIRPATIRSLVATSRQHADRIIYPVVGRKRGHPPLIPMSLCQTITGWKKDGNLREVLNSLESLSLEVSVPDENILLDIDTADDYRVLVERIQSGIES
jgi:CTP:molybdopterin cytidylyltransferase MocA